MTVTSDQQVEANRRNAENSTGPRTKAGKARSRMNAVRHGGYLKHCDEITATLLKEDPDQIDELYEALIDDLDPTTALLLTQAAAVAQQIVNQQRVSGLTASIVSSKELEVIVEDFVGPARREHAFWENLAWAVGTRDDEPNPVIAYRGLALELHQRKSTDLKPFRKPTVEPTGDFDTDLVAWRRELLKLVETTIGLAATAFPKIVATRDKWEPRAEREERLAAGIEATRIVSSFEQTSALQDRISLMIARNLKAYRELKLATEMLEV